MCDERLTRWCEYLACVVLVCVSSEIALERWVIAHVVGPIVADVPRPEPLPGHVATRMNAYLQADFPPDSGNAPILRLLVKEMLGDVTGRHRTHCGAFAWRLASQLVFEHSEQQGKLRRHAEDALVMAWIRAATSPAERLALYAQEGYFGAGNLRNSARLRLGREIEDLTSGELAFLLAQGEVGARWRSLTNRRRYVLSRFLDEGLITRAEFDAETPYGGIPESLVEKAFSCPKPPECAPTDGT